MAYKYNGSDLQLDVAWIDTEGTQYPSSWLRNSTEAQRTAVPSGGITWEVEVYYDQGFYWGPDKPKDLAGLKTIWVENQKDTANKLLAKTDWLVVRKFEKGTAIPTTTQTYRDNVRTQCGLREATINACADVDKLCNTIRGVLSPTIAGTSSNGATEKKKDDGSSYDPKQWNDIALADLLEDCPTEPS